MAFWRRADDQDTVDGLRSLAMSLTISFASSWRGAGHVDHDGFIGLYGVI